MRDREAPGASPAGGGGSARVDLDGVAARDVREGLSARPRTLPSKYFYDRRGSELFERITELPEYYLTRTEQALLDDTVGEWVREGGFRSLVELGAGSATKTRSLLDAMGAGKGGRAYLPTDVSESFLRETAERVRSSWPALEVRPVVGDMTRSLRLPEGLPAPLLVALLGSTVGNFEGEAAVGLLREIAGLLGEGDAFLLGADLRPGEGKTTEELEAAYDDAQGVTAEFNRNILRVLNRRAGTDFDPGAFAHEALYRAGEGRIEMHLRPVRPMEVRLPPGRTFRLSPEETIRTEISCKYDRPTLEGLLEAAGLRILRWTTDPRGRYAVLLAGPAGE